MRVLVVDDDSAVCDTLLLCLQYLGAEGVAVESGERALKALVEVPGFDLVITDWDMPVMSGLQLAKLITGRCPEMRVVIASGRAQLLTNKVLADAGITGILRKPFTLEQLGELVRVRA